MKTIHRPLPHHGKRLQALLSSQHRTQVWLAGELDVTRQQITKWTQSANWTTRTAQKIARALGVPWGYFYEEEETANGRDKKKGATGTATDRPMFHNQGGRILPQQSQAVNRRTR